MVVAQALSLAVYRQLVTSIVVNVRSGLTEARVFGPNFLKSRLDCVHLMSRR